MIPPENFAMVLPGLYRSSFPNEDNFNFLSTLKLKSVLFVPFSSYLITLITDSREKKRTLVQEDYPLDKLNFLAKRGIKLFQFAIPGNKEPFVHSMFFFCFLFLTEGQC